MKIIISFILFLFSISLVASQTYTGNKDDIAQILKNTEAFSGFIMTANDKMIADSYTVDAKIFVNNKEIMEGTETIRNYWKLPEGLSITYHKVTPSEIKILGDEAYDYGIYEGTTVRASGEEVSWKGKYVIIWKKVDNEWKMYLDIWNSIN